MTGGMTKTVQEIEEAYWRWRAMQYDAAHTNGRYHAKEATHEQREKTHNDANEAGERFKALLPRDGWQCPTDPRTYYPNTKLGNLRAEDFVQ